MWHFRLIKSNWNFPSIFALEALQWMDGILSISAEADYIRDSVGQLDCKFSLGRIIILLLIGLQRSSPPRGGEPMGHWTVETITTIYILSSAIMLESFGRQVNAAVFWRFQPPLRILWRSTFNTSNFVTPFQKIRICGALQERREMCGSRIGRKWGATAQRRIKS